MNHAESSPELWVCHLGTVPYREASELQHRLRERRLSGELPDTLLLLEHPPVYTRGRRSRPAELGAHSEDTAVGGRVGRVGENLGEDCCRVRDIEVVQTDRGGRVTYHGPGQLVGYPIMRVHDIGAHLRTIEAAIVAALAEEGVAARSRCAEGPDYTGVWVENRKIASIGVHVSRGIATHGFAVNVDNDLAPFDWIVACGLPGVRMTSLARELAPGHALDADAFRARVARCFGEAHGRWLRAVTPVPRFPSTRDRTSRTRPRGAATACADAPQASPHTLPPTPAPLPGALA